MQESLFIERLPLRAKPDGHGGLKFDPIIQLAITHETVTGWDKRFNNLVYDWAFDTCYTGEVITSNDFLKNQFDLFAGSIGDKIPRGVVNRHLNPNGSIRLKADGFGSVNKVSVYGGNAWIVSNLPHFKNLPVRIPLSEGIAAQPGRDRHLVGRGLLHGSGIRVQIEFDMSTPSLSMWVPTGMISAK